MRDKLWVITRILKLQKHGLKHRYSDAVKTLKVGQSGSQLFVEARKMGIIRTQLDKNDLRRTFVVINTGELEKARRKAERKLNEKIKNLNNKINKYKLILRKLRC